MARTEQLSTCSMTSSLCSHRGGSEGRVPQGPASFLLSARKEDASALPLGCWDGWDLRLLHCPVRSTCYQRSFSRKDRGLRALTQLTFKPPQQRHTDERGQDRQGTGSTGQQVRETGRVRRARFPTKTSLPLLRTGVGDTGAMEASVGSQGGLGKRGLVFL